MKFNKHNQTSNLDRKEKKLLFAFIYWHVKILACYEIINELIAYKYQSHDTNGISQPFIIQNSADKIRKLTVTRDKK